MGDALAGDGSVMGNPAFLDGSQDVAEAHMISEATQVATVAARSILSSGGSQATALKTAKAAAKSTLMGKNKNKNLPDDASVASQHTSGSLSTWAQKRKVKRQAEIVASMALAAASNSLNQGFENGSDPIQLANKPPIPPAVQGGRQTPNSVTNSTDTLTSFRKPPLRPSSPPSTQRNLSDPPSSGKSSSPTVSVKSKSSSTMEEIGSSPRPTSPTPMITPRPARPQSPHKQVLAVRSQSPTKSSPITDNQDVPLATSSTISSMPSKPMSPKINNDKEISAVDFNCEDPIYWGNPAQAKDQANSFPKREPRQVASMGNSSYGDASSEQLNRRKNPDIVYDSISDDSDYSDDEETMDEMETMDGMYTLDGMEEHNEDYKGGVVERSLDPFFNSLENMFRCSCAGTDEEEKNVEPEIQEKPQQLERRDDEVLGGGDDDGARSGAVEMDTREESNVQESNVQESKAQESNVQESKAQESNVQESKVQEELRTEDSGEVYHTIVLKSRYDPGEQPDVDVDNLASKDEEPEEATVPVPEEATVLVPVQQDKRKTQEKSSLKKKKGKMFRRKRGSQVGEF